MKKYMAYVLLLAFVILAALPALAAAPKASVPNVSVVGENISVGSEIGGVLPGTYSGMLNNGRAFDFNMKEVSIASVEKSGDTVVVKLNISGAAGEKNGDVFFAAYDAAGRLKYLSEKKDALVGTDVYTWTGTDLAGAAKIRAFVWDITTLRPLCEAKDAS